MARCFTHPRENNIFNTMRPPSSMPLLPAFVPPTPHHVPLLHDDRHSFFSPIAYLGIHCRSQPPPLRPRNEASRRLRRWVSLHSTVPTPSGNSNTDADPFYGLTEDGDFAMIGINVEEESARKMDNEREDSGNPSGDDLFRGIAFSGLMNVAGDGAVAPTVSPADSEIHVDDFVASRSVRDVDTNVDVNVNGMRSFSRGPSSRKNVQANSSTYNPKSSSRTVSSINNISLNDALFGRIQLEDSAAKNRPIREKVDEGTEHYSGIVNSLATGSIVGETTKESTSARDTKIFNDVGIHPEGKRNQSASGSVDRNNNISRYNRSSYDTKPATQQQQRQPQHNYDDEETLLTIQTIKEWLVEIIPTLPDKDLDSYARGLDEIGFHPECITMSELQLEDLSFMKVLHRRYVFHEVTGVEHPWEV